MYMQSPNTNEKNCENVLLFGAGCRGMQVYQRLKKMGFIILAFIDNNIDLIGKYIESVPILSPKSIIDMVYDKIIITTINDIMINEILAQLVDLNTEMDKVEILAYTDFNIYDEFSDPRVIWLRNFSQYVEKNNIPGNTAECGVYRGEFAGYINKYFSTRTLYLFDTFQGFTDIDIKKENSFNDSSFTKGPFANDKTLFKSTSLNIVAQYLPHPEICIVKEGDFQDTAVDLNDTFCFVNLDMDLYKPTLAALNLFWPMMSKGGVILVHDYFHINLPGILKAVSEFENTLNGELCKLPIGDFCSIAIIKSAR